jgi:hypothetical protein
MTDHTPAPAWSTDHDQVLGFARILTAAGVLESATDVLDYLEAPRTSDREHDLWTRAGRPHPPSDDDIAEARTLGANSPESIALRQRHQAASSAWEAFCDLLDDFHHTGRPARLV